MKVQCDKCKEIVELAVFTTSERGIDITCGACDESYFVAAPAPQSPSAFAPAAAPPATTAHRVDTVKCPKCSEYQPVELDACRRCGLARTRFDEFSSTVDAAASESLRALWEACVQDWDNDTAHAAFVRAAVVESAFRYAAGSYRHVLRERPGDAVAERHLADIARRAETAILHSAKAKNYDEPGAEPFKKLTLLLLVLVTLSAIGILYAMFTQSRNG